LQSGWRLYSSRRPRDPWFAARVEGGTRHSLAAMIAPVDTGIRTLALQLRLDLGLLFQEIKWALGEERINRVTPTYDQFRIWSRERDGLNLFWEFANLQLGTTAIIFNPSSADLNSYQESTDECHKSLTSFPLALNHFRRALRAKRRRLTGKKNLIQAMRAVEGDLNDEQHANRVAVITVITPVGRNVK
jgi:hypothetical protein